MKLLTMHAQLIADLEKAKMTLSMCAVAVSASIRESVTRVKLSDNLSEDMWPTLKQYILRGKPCC